MTVNVLFSLFTKKRKTLCFILKPLFIFKIFKFLSWIFGHAGKTHKISVNMWIVIVCESVCDVMNHERNIACLIKPVVLHDQKVKTKIWISWEWKELYLKGLLLEQIIKQTFLEGEGPTLKLGNLSEWLYSI